MSDRTCDWCLLSLHEKPCSISECVCRVCEVDDE